MWRSKNTVWKTILILKIEICPSFENDISQKCLSLTRDFSKIAERSVYCLKILAELDTHANWGFFKGYIVLFLVDIYPNCVKTVRCLSYHPARGVFPVHFPIRQVQAELGVCSKESPSFFRALIPTKQPSSRRLQAKHIQNYGNLPNYHQATICNQWCSHRAWNGGSGRFQQY